MQIVRFCKFLVVAVPIFEGTAFGQGHKVVGVSYGDTITALDEAKRQIKVRLAGTDAPERGQVFANRSKQNRSRLVFGKQVTLEGKKIDRYGRRVVKVGYVGVDLGLRTFAAVRC